MNKKFLAVLLILISWTHISYGQGHGLFIENKGQYPSNVKYYSEFRGGILFVEETTLTYSFFDPGSAKFSHSHDAREINEPLEGHAIKINFLEAGNGQSSSGQKATVTNYNYLYGNDPDKWISNVKGYDNVEISDLYPGIDLKLSANQGRIKYDLIVHPGNQADCIKMRYDGVEDLRIIGEELSFTIPYGELSEQIPASYAICDNEERVIKSNYVLEGDIVSFRTSETDDSETVVIDPVLVFSTYSGSPSDNWGNTATFDKHGNAYAGGITQTERNDQFLGFFPATSGAFQELTAGGWDVAISKYDSTGSELLYATHIGGSGTDVPQSLIVDENDELYILGVTSSDNFPVTTIAYDTSFNGGINQPVLDGVNMDNGSDLFIAKLSEDGSSLLASTYLGGRLNDGLLESGSNLARNYGDESRGDIINDSEGNVIIASRTNSPDFPTNNGFDDGFNGNTDGIVAKFNTDLTSLVWSTFLGGISDDVALSVKIGKEDDVFIAGGTESSNFPTTRDVYRETYGGAVDGWTARLTKEGDSLIASSYIGTDSYDQAFFLDIDANEDVYLLGQTTSSYPVTLGKYSNGVSGQFLHKFSNNLKESFFSTVIGADNRSVPSISLTAFLVNECDNIYLSGWGSPSIARSGHFTLNTIGLPITNDAHQLFTDGSSFYLAVLSGNAEELLYATHLGTQSSYVHVDGGTSRFDKHGIVYHSVCASCADNDSSFPTTEGAYAELNSSIGCSNAIFKFDLASLRAKIQTNNLELTDPGMNGGCLPLPVVFENFTTAGEIFTWDFGDGSTRTVYSKDTIVHYYKNPGTFNIELHALDPNTCIAEDWAYTNVTVAEPIFTVPEDKDICFGSSVKLIATGGTSYEWTPAEGLDNPFSGSPIATPTDTTRYTVRIANSNGCNFQGDVVVNVVPEIIADIQVEQSNLCLGSREIRLINNSENAESISWSLGDGTVIENWESDYRFASDGNYTISATLRSEFCVKQVSFDMNIIELHIPNVLTRNNDGYNEVFKISSGSPLALNIYNRWGTKVFESADYQNDWSGNGLKAGLYFYEVILINGEVCSGWVQLLNSG